MMANHVSHMSWFSILVIHVINRLFLCFGFQVPAVYEEMMLSGCTPDRKARGMLRSALRYMKQTLRT